MHCDENVTAYCRQESSVITNVKDHWLMRYYQHDYEIQVTKTELFHHLL